MHIPVTGFATAFCGLLLVLPAAHISLPRTRLKVALGGGGHKDRC